MQSGRVTIKKMHKLSNKELTNYLEFFQLLNFTANLFKSFTLSGAPSLPILKEHMDLFWSLDRCVLMCIFKSLFSNKLKFVSGTF